jgi:hypothetical protein
MVSFMLVYILASCVVGTIAWAFFVVGDRDE